MLAVASRAHAEYRYDYSHALAAYQDGDYAKAGELFRKALQQNPEPAVRIRLYGQVWKPYLPQYYLGLIAFRQGDCKTALAQWEADQNQAVVAKVPKIADVQQRNAAECHRRLLATSKPPAPAAGQAKPAQPKVVAENIRQKSVSSPPQNARVPATSHERSKPVASHVDKVSKAPPASLLRAFDDYLAGRYARVESIDPATYSDGHARFQAYLVRAAARFTLARLSGNDEDLGAARQDVRAARALDDHASPDAIMFSPTFRAFFKRPD